MNIKADGHEILLASDDGRTLHLSLADALRLTAGPAGGDLRQAISQARQNARADVENKIASLEAEVRALRASLEAPLAFEKGARG